MLAKSRLLVVDDDPLIVDALRFVLADCFAVEVASSRHDAIQLAKSSPFIDLALIDLGLPPFPHSPTEGLALITELLAISPEAKIVVLSGQNDDANARLARTLGATDFVAKPVSPSVLKELLFGLGNLKLSSQSNAKLIGGSRAIAQLRQQLSQFARSSFPVLIEGESGTGKELAARILHDESDRCGAQYLAINCAAMNPSLVESALFGHVKGSFTGATNSRLGYFEEAAEGTLFLDEIGELPLELQSKLLRVLENGEFQRVGETRGRVSTARIIAATNRDLREEIRSGRFRSDLYHRLSVFTVRMPALREMGDDRRVLLEHFVREFAAQGKVLAPVITDSAWQIFSAYGLPGNVREVRNIAIRLTARHAGREVTASEMSDEIDPDSVDHSPPFGGRQLTGDAIATREKRTGEARLTLTARTGFSLDDELRAIEAAYVSAAQELSGGNLSQAARLLGLSRTTLYHRIESLARASRK